VTNSGESRVQRPFWLHQVVEYILGIVLISQGLQLREPLTLTTAGIAILINAAVVSGPLSAFKWTTRGAHKVCDLVLILGLIAVGLQPLWAMDTTSRSILVAVAVVMFMVWRLTDYRPPVRKSPQKRERPLRDRSQIRSKNPEQVGRAAGRAAGGIVRRWRQQQ
jgi:hypothetical protein